MSIFARVFACDSKHPRCSSSAPVVCDTSQSGSGKNDWVVDEVEVEFKANSKLRLRDCVTAAGSSIVRCFGTAPHHSFLNCGMHRNGLGFHRF